jgi:hypothetical protein
MSVVIIAIDRYLLICHGYYASWSKTGMLVLGLWFISLAFPAAILFPILPNSVILANGLLCYPNYASNDQLKKAIFIMAIGTAYSAMLLVACSYANVFVKYNTLLKRREGGQEMSQNESVALSPKSKLLLKKLVMLTANYICSFLPHVLVQTTMLAIEAEVPELVAVVALLIFAIGLFLNPLLIYFLDAKMKQSVNQMLGLDKIFFPKNQTLHSPERNQNGVKMLHLSPAALNVHTLALNDSKTVQLPRSEI